MPSGLDRSFLMRFVTRLKRKSRWSPMRPPWPCFRPAVMLLSAAASTSALFARAPTMADAMPPRARAPTMDATSSARGELCSVLLMDDGFNMREYVARVLMMVCELSESEADRLMMQAHWEYSSVVGTWERPVAQHICDGLKQAGLHAAIQPESAIQTDSQDPDEPS